METHIIFQSLRCKIALIIVIHATAVTIKLLFFIIGVDIRSHSKQNVFTYDTHLSHAKCAFQWMTLGLGLGLGLGFNPGWLFSFKPCLSEQTRWYLLLGVTSLPPSPSLSTIDCKVHVPCTSYKTLPTYPFSKASHTLPPQSIIYKPLLHIILIILKRRHLTSALSFLVNDWLQSTCTMYLIQNTTHFRSPRRPTPFRLRVLSTNPFSISY